jgi:hypothetical protein
VRAVAGGGKHFGTLILESHADGAVAWRLLPPRSEDDVFRPTSLMERISRALEVAMAPLSRNAIFGAVKGDDKAKRLALEMLVGEGFVVIERALGSRLHRSAKLRSGPSDDHTSATRSDDV